MQAFPACPISCKGYAEGQAGLVSILFISSMISDISISEVRTLILGCHENCLEFFSLRLANNTGQNIATSSQMECT